MALCEMGNGGVTTKEVWSPVIFEDFGIGDRVYRHDPVLKETTFGTIIDIETGSFKIKFDNEEDLPGQEPLTFFAYFIRDYMGKSTFRVEWGKALDLSQVNTGSVLSFMDYETKTRQYAQVTLYPTNKTFISLTFVDESGNMVGSEMFYEESEKSLEFQLRDYVLEG